MITHKTDSIINSNENIIAHGCNCSGSFAAGVAGLLSNKYPKTKEAYFKKFHNGTGWILGDVQLVCINDERSRYVANCATQQTYGNAYKTKRVYVCYDAIQNVMIQLRDECEKKGWSLAMPRIGAGLGGGDWEKIEAIITRVFENSQVEVVIYTLPSPTKK